MFSKLIAVAWILSKFCNLAQIYTCTELDMIKKVMIIAGWYQYESV